MATSENSERFPRLSRKGALRAFGLGAAGAVAGPSLLADQVAAAAQGGHAAVPNHFGRLFPTLPAFAKPSPSLHAALLELGRPGGLLDAGDDLSAGPVRLITDPALSRNNPNNPAQTAGTTFLGQFIDHDVTFDASSRLGVRTDPAATRNFRSPALDLDSVYGAGYVAQQELYDAADRIKLRIESGGLFEDVPRRADGAAIVADPRNDEHIIISGLHAAFIRFHNACVDTRPRLRPGRPPASCSRAPAGSSTWHYQWIVVHEFLPEICGDARVRAALRKRRLFRPHRGQAQIPVEFQAAAYRMGHSMVRPSYRANLAGDSGAAVLRVHLRPLAGRRLRPGRPPRGLPRAAPLRRLADVLRLRRRSGEAEQADRHQALDAALPPAAGCDRKPRPAHRPAPADAAPPPDVVAAERPGDRTPHRRGPSDAAKTSRSSRRWGTGSTARHRSGTTS